MKRKSVITFLYFFISALFLFAGGPYRITKIKPNQKILIGKKWCGLDDIFYGSQVVHWDSKLSQQAFEADDVNNPSLTINMSKERVRKQTASDISYEALCSLIGKGEEDFFTLWEGDTLKIKIDIDDTYLYRLRFYDTLKIVNLMASKDQLFIPWDLFEGREGVVKFYIDRKNKNERTDIEIIDNFEVELIK